MKIALDAMGGDLAPAEQVKGAVLAAKDFDVEVALVGPRARLETELARHGNPRAVSIVAAEDTIAMDEDRIVQSVRQKREASINVAMGLVRDGEAQGVVSAGNTGAVMASALFLLGRMRGIERPALATLLPYNAGRVLLLDIGANPECRPNHLYQFAQMANAYMEKVVGVARPRIGLLNVGEESAKGNELAQETFEKLRDSELNFVGNVEGVTVHKGVCDVIVTDGFTGNIALKVGEGIADYILEQIRSALKSSPVLLFPAILFKPAMRRVLRKLQYEEYGGAHLLGVNGIVVIGHGRSDALAFRNGIRVAKLAAASGLLDAMRASLAPPEPGSASAAASGSGIGG